MYADMSTDKEKAVLLKLGQFLTRILVKLDPSYIVNMSDQMGGREKLHWILQLMK